MWYFGNVLQKLYVLFLMPCCLTDFISCRSIWRLFGSFERIMIDDKGLCLLLLLLDRRQGWKILEL
jgi:hypothetical protein